MQTYLGYFGHAWLHSPKTIVSPCSKLYLHAKNKLHNSLLFYNITFWRILQFDWLAAIWPITWDPKLCQICWWDINNNISFCSELFATKTNMTKVFKKSRKPYFGSILGPFAQIWTQKEFSWKKGSVSFSVFELSIIVPKIRKTKWAIPEKTFGGTHQNIFH